MSGFLCQDVQNFQYMLFTKRIETFLNIYFGKMLKWLNIQ